jgi:hypothetical protein
MIFFYEGETRKRGKCWLELFEVCESRDAMRGAFLASKVFAFWHRLSRGCMGDPGWDGSSRQLNSLYIYLRKKKCINLNYYHFH